MKRLGLQPFAGTFEGVPLAGEVLTEPRGSTTVWEWTLSADGRMLAGGGLSTASGTFQISATGDGPTALAP